MIPKKNKKKLKVAQTQNQFFHWWRLKLSPAKYNECIKWELSEAWEPTCSGRPLSFDERKSSQDCVPHETKQTVDEMRKIKDELNFQGGLVVPCDGSWGGLVMLWKEEVNLHIQMYSPHHINAIILIDPGVPWQITGFYGYSKECRKHDPRPCCTIFTHSCFFHGCL